MHGWNRIVNNVEIERRCRNPELFDRNGKFKDDLDNEQAFYPALSNLETRYYPNTIPQTNSKDT